MECSFRDLWVATYDTVLGFRGKERWRGEWRKAERRKRRRWRWRWRWRRRRRIEPERRDGGGGGEGGAEGRKPRRAPATLFLLLILSIKHQNDLKWQRGAEETMDKHKGGKTEIQTSENESTEFWKRERRGEEGGGSHSPPSPLVRNDSEIPSDNIKVSTFGKS